ncbi:Sensor histidine kinase CitA [Caballeronia sp. SBC2]|nr:Sensor histidine kinase CitA [Caballeronia sp. SBC2]
MCIRNKCSWAKFKTLSFQTRTFLLLFCVSSALLLGMGCYVYSSMHSILYGQIGLRARVQAQQIAVMPALVAAVGTRDATALAALILPLKEKTDASYIVIGDDDGRHLAHTDPTVPVGSPMRGGDNEGVLRDGKSIVTLSSGMHGMSWRGKAPVHDPHGRIIGVVSVGYFISSIDRWNHSMLAPLLLVVAGTTLFLLCCTWLFARSIRRQMRGLDPIGIAQLVQQQDAIFDSIYEGVLSIDAHSRLTSINRAAREMLNVQTPREHVLIDSLLPDCPFMPKGQDDHDRKDEICWFNSLQVIASRVGIRIGGQLHGWVISFRRKDDINTLSLQLSEVKRYADNLRVIRHEHQNWISTLSGLLHIGAFEEAKRLIHTQSAVQQQVLDRISRTFGDYRVCGLLIGKYYRARELGLTLQFESGCSLDRLPSTLADVEWMSIIGNLIDNALEATIACDHPEKKVILYLCDRGDELIIEVADFGCGIEPSLRERLFERGVSSHDGSGRGIGLYLVNSYVQQAGATITIEDNIPHGTIFSVFAPIRSISHAEH